MKSRLVQVRGRSLPNEDRQGVSSGRRLDLLANALCDLAANVARRDNDEVKIERISGPSPADRMSGAVALRHGKLKGASSNDLGVTKRPNGSSEIGF